MKLMTSNAKSNGSSQQKILDAPFQMQTLEDPKEEDEGSIWIQKVEDNLVGISRALPLEFQAALRRLCF